MHTLNGHPALPVVWEGSDEAAEWLVPEYSRPPTERYTVERQEGFEAEILPALAAIIPAIISAAPAIINAVSSLVSSSKKPAPPANTAPARPPQAPTPSPAPAKPAPVPLRTAQVARPAPKPAPTPAPAPTPSAPSDDVTTQLAALIPVLAALVADAAAPQPGPQAAPQEVLLESDLGPLCSEADTESGGYPSVEDIEPEDIEPEDTDTEDIDTEDTDTEQLEASTTKRDEQQLALVPLPDRATINVGVSPCPTSLLVARFGRPRDELSNECQATTSAFWRDRMTTESVGPFRVTGHRNAVGVFRDAFAALKASHPDLYERVGSAGMLCVRHIRGRPGVLSNHALGMALDLTIDGRLEVRDDDLVQRGLVTVHEVFTRLGIFWGAGLRIEDAMHFEIGADLVTQWIQEGSI